MRVDIFRRLFYNGYVWQRPIFRSEGGIIAGVSADATPAKRQEDFMQDILEEVKVDSVWSLVSQLCLIR